MSKVQKQTRTDQKRFDQTKNKLHMSPSGQTYFAKGTGSRGKVTKND